MFIISISTSGKGHHEDSGDQKAGQELPLLSGCGQDEILILQQPTESQMLYPWLLLNLILCLLPSSLC